MLKMVCNDHDVRGFLHKEKMVIRETILNSRITILFSNMKNTRDGTVIFMNNL
jgi:hypothetical protein